MHIKSSRAARSARKAAAATICATLMTGIGITAVTATSASAAVTARPNVVELSIGGASDLLSKGKTTSTALVKEYLARIAAYDGDTSTAPGLHAVIAVNSQAAAEAASLDAERAAGKVRGPLHGVPIVIKDNIDLVGMPTTNGAIAFATYKPKNDSTVAKKLRAAGAIIIAKTNLSEFAWSGSDAKSGLGGEVRNPYDRSKTSSGSSGGTAAAVAASFATGGLGTDTYGSIRNPSGNQGLVGVRPTHGLVSLTGVTAQVAPLDTVGPMTKTVEDAAILLDAIAGYDSSDHYTKETIGQVPESYRHELSTTALKGKKIVYFTTQSYHGGTRTNRPEERAEVAAIQAKAVDELRAQGATVELVSLTAPENNALFGRGWSGVAHWMDEFFANNDAVWPKGLAAKAAPFNKLTVADYLADDRETAQIKPDADWFLSTGNYTQADEDAAVAKQTTARANWAAFLAEHDADAVAFPNDNLAASPITEDPAGYSAASTNADLASSLGTPAVTLPIGLTNSGLPISIQLTGALYSEAELLSYAYDYEQATHARTAPKSTPELPRPAVVKSLSVSTKRSGTLKVGRTLSVSVTPRSEGVKVLGTKVTYRWTVAGKYAGKSRALRLTKKMVGKKVRVKVTASKAGYTTSSKTYVLGKVKKR